MINQIRNTFYDEGQDESSLLRENGDINRLIVSIEVLDYCIVVRGVFGHV